MNDIRAITVDLDDTLWPLEPVIDEAEKRLYDWLAAHCPRVIRSHTAASMRDLRLAVARSEPHIAHDLTEVRRRALHRIIVTESGYPACRVDGAMAEFLEHRNRVELFPDALPFLESARRRFPILSLTNGNASLARLGLRHLFHYQISAAQVGAAKPDPRLFQAACERLRTAPERVLHVGDHPVQDILGAARAGMKTVWVNRTGAEWREAHRADHEVTSLREILALLPQPSPGER